MSRYIKPKAGDTVICIDDDSQNEDLGMSGIVLSGTKGLSVGKEYKIQSLDFSDVPKRIHENGYAIWTKEEYDQVQWSRTMAFIVGHGFYGRMYLRCFKRT